MKKDSFMMLPAIVFSSFFLVVVKAHPHMPCPSGPLTKDICWPTNPKCQISKQGVSDADKQIILDAHNSDRNTIAQGLQPSNASGGNFPQAANMIELVWDDELKSNAQQHADQCIQRHDCPTCREAFTGHNKWVGQNIYQDKSSGPIEKVDWKKAIKAWYAENRYYPVSGISNFQKVDGEKTEHFTQVIWATTQQVGCGVTFSNNLDADDSATKPYSALYVCNYDPGQGVRGSEIYEAGKPASDCPQSYTPSTQYPGLCTNSAGQ